MSLYMCKATQQVTIVNLFMATPWLAINPMAKIQNN